MAEKSIEEKTPLVSGSVNVCEEDLHRFSRIRNLVVANVIVCLLYVSSSIYSPVMSQYVYHRVSVQVFGNDSSAYNFSTLAPCFQNTSDPGYILQEKAQTKSSQVMLQFTVLYSAMSVLTNLLLGTYSDFIGRKFVYVLCICGYLVRTAITVVIIHWELDLNYFYLASGMFGLTGGTWSFTLVSYAYTADNTPPHQSRSLWLAVIEAVTGLSSALASYVAGYFIQYTGYFYPCLTASLINAVSLLVIIFALQETRPRQHLSCRILTQGVRNMVGVYFPKGGLKKALMWIGLLIFFFSIINNSSASNLDTLFMMNLPFCWSPVKMGLFWLVALSGKNLVGVFLVKGMQMFVSDEFIGIVSTMSATGGDLIWAFANSDWMLYVGVPVVGLVGFAATPIIRGIMSKMVSADRQGALFASLAIIEAGCSTFGTPLFNKIYQGSLSCWTGLIYVAMAANHGVAILLYGLFIPYFRKDRRRSTPQLDECQK